MRYYLPSSVLLYLLLTMSASGQTPSLGLNAPQLYEKGMNSLGGVGVSRNNLNAVDYLHRSAELGYAPAQVAIGYFYDTGSVLPQDSGQAADWYKKATKQDDRLADWLLGRLYFTGSGVPRDLSTAEPLLGKAANQGDPFGQFLLGLVLLERSDYPKAAEWFRKAAMQGLPQAQAQLGALLKDGRGVTVDKFEAYLWFLLSFDAGNQTVSPDLAILEGDLGINRVDEAKNKARDLAGSVSRAVVSRGCSGWAGEFDPIPVPPPPDLHRFCR